MKVYNLFSNKNVYKILWIRTFNLNIFPEVLDIIFAFEFINLHVWQCYLQSVWHLFDINICLKYNTITRDYYYISPFNWWIIRVTFERRMTTRSSLNLFVIGHFCTIRNCQTTRMQYEGTTDGKLLVQQLASLAPWLQQNSNYFRTASI